MAIQAIMSITDETLDEYIIQAAKAAGYEKGFGIRDCDLSKPIWWAAYCRQSLDQQTQNNRLPEYFFTLAKMAREQSVVVPREYILYDHKTGEHLERPNMIYLRKLMSERLISGIIFPALDRLSREPLHQQIFELEAAHYGVQLQYADAPSGNDPGSQFARTILAHAAKLVNIANRKNNRGGNIGRVLNRNVPAGKTPYGYKYHADYEDLGHGRRKLLAACWLVDKLDPGGEPERESEAWLVTRIFQWVGHENRTLYWVAKELNKLGVKPRYANEWSPSLISFIVKNHCYVGRHIYNRGTYVPNPKKPIGDVTAAIKRTIRQLKPESEWVQFKVPLLVSENLWKLANQNLMERGRGKGKEGKQIDALLRGRVFCPSCGRLLSIYRDSNYRHLIYYVCATRSQGWKHKRCLIHSYRIDWLDGVVWDCVYALLKQPEWIEEELSKQEANEHVDELRKRIGIEHQRINRTQAKIRRIQEGYEADPPVYTTSEAEENIKAYRDLISQVEKDIYRLQEIMAQQTLNKKTKEEVRCVLDTIRDMNLENVSFSDKQNLIAKLGIKVYLSEDKKVVRISSIIQPDPCPFKFSPQKISMASPKL